MTLYQAEYRSRIRRERSREAIALAMENRWEEAAAINRSILEMFPDDVEVHNRLGKALSEVGRYEEAREAFARTLALSPSNSIARKNMERLSLLVKEKQPILKKRPKLGPEDFLEESGKTATVVLENPAEREVLAKLAAGDAVTLRIDDSRLAVQTAEGEYLGQLPPRLGLRLIKLMQGGNQYEAAVARVSGGEMTVILREVFRHPSQQEINSFPTRSEQLVPYPQSPILESDLLEEEEGAFSGEWDEGEEENDDLSRPTLGQEPALEEEEES